MKRKPQASRPSRQSEGEGEGEIRIGNISGGKGFAIGSGAKAVVIEIGSLLDLGILLPLIKRHWRFLTANVVLQAMAVALWWRYTDRFLIPVWVLLIGVGLLEVGLISGYGLRLRPQRRRPFALLATASLLALMGLAGSEYRRVIYPVPFDREAFGVAVAQFGEGPEFHNTPQAREVSRLVLQRLTQQAQENPDLSFIQFKPIGLVRTQDEALEEGQRINADLVIWGQLQVSESATILNFAIVETPDKVSNPTFPRAIPITEQAATGLIEIPSRKSEEIAARTTTIAAFTFGLAHYFKWDLRSSVIAFQEVLETSPTQANSYLLHLYFGLSLQGIGELIKAGEQFRQAAVLNPEDPAAPLGLAYGYKSLGQVEEAQTQAWLAIDLCTRRLKLRPDDALTFYDRAVAYEALEDWEAALTDYSQAIVEDPTLYVARLSQIRVLTVLTKLPEAIQAGLQTVEIAEDRGANAAWAYSYLARAYQLSTDVHEARLAYQKAIALAPQVDWIHGQASKFYESVGDFEAAEAEGRAMLAVSNNPASAHAGLADLYVRTNQLNKAATEYEESLRIDPSFGGIWIKLADVYARLERINEARKAYERAAIVEPDNFYVREAYGRFLYSQGEWASAIGQWQEAITEDPTNCYLWLNMGSAYEALGNTAKAREVYTQALSLEVDSSSNCYSIASQRLAALTP